MCYIRAYVFMSEYQNLWILSHLSESIDVPGECNGKNRYHGKELECLHCDGKCERAFTCSNNHIPEIYHKELSVTKPKSPKHNHSLPLQEMFNVIKFY